MNENTGFVAIKHFPDPEAPKKATDPKKQGEPFAGKVEASLDKDMPKSSKTPLNAGEPFDNDPKKLKDTTFGTVKDAEYVPDNSVANAKPTGAKTFKVTGKQMLEFKKKMNEGFYDDEDDMGDMPTGGGVEGYDLGRKYKKGPEMREPEFDEEPEEDFGDEYSDDMSLDDDDIELEEEELDEISWNGIKNVGGMVGNSVKNAAKGAVGAVGNAYKGASDAVGKYGAELQQGYNKGAQNDAIPKVTKLAQQLKAQIDQLNAATVKAGGQPLNMQSIMSVISNQISKGGNNVDLSRYRTEDAEVEEEGLDEGCGKPKTDVAEGKKMDIEESFEIDENELMEVILNAFGNHPKYGVEAFTTPPENMSNVEGTRDIDDASVKNKAKYGTKIGSSAPFTQKVAEKNEAPKTDDSEVDKSADTATKNSLVDKLTESIIKDLKKKR